MIKYIFKTVGCTVLYELYELRRGQRNIIWNCYSKSEKYLGQEGCKNKAINRADWPTIPEE